MDPDLKPWVVALGLYASSGGPTKTIASFRQALGSAEMVNFVDPVPAKREEWAMPGATVLQAPPVPVLRYWCQPPRKELHLLENRMLQGASLISCHSFFRFHNLWVLRMKLRHGIPYWLVPHGSLDPYVFTSGKIAKHAFLRIGGMKFLREAACIIFSTEAEWRKAETMVGPLKGKVVPWPVKTDQVEEREKRRRFSRIRLNIPPEDTVLVFFGRIHSMKRPLETLQAVAEADSGNLHLLIVGPEGDIPVEACRKKAEELSFPRLHITGPLYGDNKADVLLSADAYISFSHRENFNHAAAECLALGIPVILSPGNDLAQGIQEAGCGWTAEGDGPDDRRKLIRQFLATPKEEWRERGASGTRWVEREFSFPKFYENIQELVHLHSRTP